MLHELLTALRRRLELVADRRFCQHDPQGHLAALQQADAKVRQLAASLPESADPHLLHFLERQSYVKAVAWLEEHLRVTSHNPTSPSHEPKPH